MDQERNILLNQKGYAKQIGVPWNTIREKRGNRNELIDFSHSLLLPCMDFPKLQTILMTFIFFTL